MLPPLYNELPDRLRPALTHRFSAYQDNFIGTRCRAIDYLAEMLLLFLLAHLLLRLMGCLLQTTAITFSPCSFSKEKEERGGAQQRWGALDRGMGL